ncbi:MAG: PTS sorbitol transporter [Chloroflexi bacterium]|nr:PTS sorbitol transporter [Chloroflexota bacterium]
MSTKYKKVKITKGNRGWGGPLIIAPDENKNVICSVTGGGIHPLAQRVADLTGAEAVDGFKKGVPFEKMALVVIDCGGTARIGVYPMKKVPTVDIYPTNPTGPLAHFITEDIFVSGVKEEDIQLID